MASPYYTYGGNLLNREKYTSTVNTTYGVKRYFSSIDTDVYFGDILVDEMVAFDFILEEKKIPIYGYNNFTPKRIITGEKTIQGSFAINFTQTFSLKTIIDGLAESIYANAYEETQFFCGDDNKALFGKGFDITISYGDHKGEGSYNSCVQTLVGCYITSYRQAFDTSGEPILDMYTFIAKDLIVHESAEAEEPAIPEDTTTENVTDKEPDTPERYKIANNEIQEECDELYAYCKEHPETLGVFINPTYDYVGGKHRISMFISSCEHYDELLIDEITINLTDTLIKGSYSFKFDKRIDTYNFYYEMTGTNVNVGEEIKKLFADDNEYLECVVYIKCNNRKEEWNIEESTRLHCGTIETVYND